MPANMLIIEDTATMAALYANYLGIAGFSSDIAEDGTKGMTLLSQKPYAAVILDLHLPDINGIDILKHIKNYYEDTPVIVVTAYGSINVAVDSMKFGAYDFIMKPFPASRLNTTVQNALENRKMRRELKQLRAAVHQDNYGNFIGSSPAMQALFRQIEAVAPSRASIFISGESGTGKELVAQSLHRASPRAPKPFVALNCAAIPTELLESEIFGHVKGAFTGASNDRQGAAKWADGGTLFLDEICEMPLELQAKLLRFVQTGAYTPVGASRAERSDIRFICATNRDAGAEVEAGRMREDLYYRLHVVPIDLPPLREREDDVVELADAFLKQFAAEENKKFVNIDPEVLAVFRNSDWPGNVRQLQNIIRQIVVMNDGPTVTPAMLPDKFSPRQPMDKTTNVENFAVKPLWQLEKETILRTLRACKDDVGKAAAMLEVSPSTVYRKLQAWRDMEAAPSSAQFTAVSQAPRAEAVGA